MKSKMYYFIRVWTHCTKVLKIITLCSLNTNILVQWPKLRTFSFIHNIVLPAAKRANIYINQKYIEICTNWNSTRSVHQLRCTVLRGIKFSEDEKKIPDPSNFLWYVLYTNWISLCPSHLSHANTIVAKRDSMHKIML